MKNKLNILSIISILVSFFLLVMLFFFNILPFKYYLLGVILMIIFNIGSVIVINRKSKLLKVVGVSFLLLLTLFNGYGIYVVNNTNNLLNGISEFTEKSVYYVVVNKDSKYNMLSDLDDKDIGVIKDDGEVYLKVLDKLNSKVKIDINYYSKLPGMYNDLLNNEIDSILINSNTYEIVCEYNLNFKENSKIIDKISIKIKKDKEEDIKLEKESFNILISGIDTYGSINTVSRSDVNIIVTVNTNTHEVLFTTIPRDTEVQLHNTVGLTDKLTHAGIYGIDMSRQTLEDFFNTSIDYYVRVNFNSLISIVDSIGGVDIDNDVAFSKGGNTYPIGRIHLDGTRALQYSRERKLMPEGDFTRGLHQVKVLEAIIRKATTSPELLANYSKFSQALAGFVQTNINEDVIKKMVRDQLSYTPNWTFNTQAVSCNGSMQETYSMPGMNLYVAIPNEESRVACSNTINTVLNNK